jgi:signal transduction histidine kinase
MALDAETRTEHFARQPDRLSNSYFEFLAAYEHTLTQLAMELHDNVGQQLLELTRRLATAAERAQRSPVLRHELAELNELALDLSVQLRHVMHKARPQALSDFGVYNAVEDLARRLRKSCGIVFTVQCMGEKRRLPAEVETNLYRILQEAMSNIVKHSDARVANVSFFFLEQAVEIVVSDDGRGLPPEPERTPGIGLRSMVHRAEGIGAELRVSAPPNQGTTLHIVLPTGTRSPQEPVQPNPASVGPAAQPRPFPQKAPAERDASSALPVRRRQR